VLFKLLIQKKEVKFQLFISGDKKNGKNILIS